MTDVLRLIAINICIPIYTSIPKLYSIFYNLANARFFEDDSAIRHLSSNIYILISVVMLFVFSATLLSAIVDPERLDDKNKGVVALIKRCFFGVILIVIIPFAFNTAYDVQQQVMEKSLIEKVLVGFSFDKNTAGNSNGGGNGGQVIAGSLIQAVIYPVEDDISATTINQNIADTYEKMITDDVEKMRLFAPDINAVPSNSTSDAEYVFEFQGLIAIIAGAVTLYILLIFAIDTAVRLFQLALYELTSPIIIVAYMAKGKESLTNWAKQVWSVYLDVFMRIAAMAIYIFMIQQLPNLVENFKKVNSTQTTWHLLFSVILIVGLLIFVKRIPDLINKALGTKISIGGGIGGRLGQMALIGKQAQKAWDSIREHPIQSIGRPVGAVAGTAANIGNSFARGWQYSRRTGNGVGKSLLSSAGAGLWSTIKAPSTFKRGWKTGNLRAIGNEIARDRATHPEGSTIGGRAKNVVRDMFGLGTTLDQMNYNIAKNNRLSLVGADGKTRFYTDSEAKELQSQNDKIKNHSQSAIDAVKKELERKDSKYLEVTGKTSFTYMSPDGQKVEFNFKNFSEAEQTIESLRKNAPKEGNFYKRQVGTRTGMNENGDIYEEAIYEKCKANDDGAILDIKAYMDEQAKFQNSISEFSKQIRNEKKEATKTLLNIVSSGTGNFSMYNTDGDDSNYSTASNDIKIINSALENPEYASNVKERSKIKYDVENNISAYDVLEKINTAAEKASNDVNKAMADKEINKSMAYTAEDYKTAVRDNKATKASGQDNKPNYDQNANDIFRG